VASLEAKAVDLVEASSEEVEEAGAVEVSSEVAAVREVVSLAVEEVAVAVYSVVAVALAPVSSVAVVADLVGVACLADKINLVDQGRVSLVGLAQGNTAAASMKRCWAILCKSSSDYSRMDK
jgi:hypothetical protein